MTTKSISYDKLKEAIKIAFDGDRFIVDLYDPNIKVESIEDVQKDIFRKLKAFDGDNQVIIKGVYEKNELIGYYFRRSGLLISFSLAVKFRTRVFLRKFFALIKDEFKGCFSCLLWSKNERAIRWLLKNDMQIAARNGNITQLITK